MKDEMFMKSLPEIIRKALLAVDSAQARCRKNHKRFSSDTKLLEKSKKDVEKCIKGTELVPDDWKMNTVSDAFYAIHIISDYASEYGSDYRWMKHWKGTIDKLSKMKKSVSSTTSVKVHEYLSTIKRKV